METKHPPHSEDASRSTDRSSHTRGQRAATPIAEALLALTENLWASGKISRQTYLDLQRAITTAPPTAAPKLIRRRRP